MRAGAAITLATLAAASCGAGASGTQSTHAAMQSRSSGRTTAARLSRYHGRQHLVRHRQHVPGRASQPLRRSSTLALSTAANDVVQRQPRPGSCQQIGSGIYSQPDASCTPGALNPAVTQATIHRTICVSGWTDTVRPPEAITEQEKPASMATYGDSGPMGAYEYDHFVPLELGGATNDAGNLWPEPGASPNPKDAVEDELRAEVCDGQMSLAQAQQAIVTNWVSLGRRAAAPMPTAPAPVPARTTTGSALCTVTASYNSRYDDYDVYVHSHQADQTVMVTDSAGRSRSWHTDGSGYADVYFDAGGDLSGVQVTVRVGAAMCSTTL